MNGSYSVPIGSSRTPLMTCDRPSADSRMNRFASAMPSSMCWPLGENSQLKVEGICSLLKVSASASRANSPRRFTQGPRLVETVTSGEAVTMRLRELVVAAADLVEDRAEAGLRRHHRLHGDGKFVRHRDGRRLELALGRLARAARGRENLAASVGRRSAGLRTCPTRGPAARCWPRGTCPSAPASSGRRGCPCGRRTAGRSP